LFSPEFLIARAAKANGLLLGGAAISIINPLFINNHSNGKKNKITADAKKSRAKNIDAQQLYN
jgi:hypothetical protein